MSSAKPKLIVFDLDYTLWPFWVDTHVTPPFRRKSNGQVVDAYDSKVKIYPEVPQMLKGLYEEGYSLGIASRTSEIEGANELVDLLGWGKYFRYREIFPGSKVTHFNNFRRSSGFEYKEMLFFDDEHRNIVEIERLGVVSIFVKNGMSMKVLQEGLDEFAKRRRTSVEN